MSAPELPVRWGLVGCGWLGRDFAAPAIRDSATGVLAAVCDPDPAARAAVPASASDADLSTMLGRDDLDAVYIATPNHLHRDQAVAAAKAGKHVLCEKPLALNAADAAAIVDACRDAGVLFATAFDQRWHGAHQTLRRAIADGRLGRVTLVRVHYACWTPPDWRPGDWDHDNWRVDPDRAGGGAMIDLAPHGLDLAQTLLNERIVDLHCLMQSAVHDVPVDDGAVLVGRTDRGTLVNLSVAYNCPDALPRRRLEVVGTTAMAVALNTMGQTPGGKLTLIDAATGDTGPLDFSALDRSPFLNQVEAFNDAVLGRSPWPFDPEGDVHTQRLLDKAAAGSAVQTASGVGV